MEDQLTLGALVSAFYEEYLELYEDEDMASVAAAASVNHMLIEQETADEVDLDDDYRTAA